MQRSHKGSSVVVLGKLSRLPALYFPGAVLNGSTLKLSITIAASGPSIRNFGAYLTLTDKTYGRMDALGLRSYSQREGEHLRVSEFKGGSLEIEILKEIITTTDATRVLILFLFLKCFPNIVKAASKAFRDFQEGLLARKRRNLLDKMAQEPQLQQMRSREIKDVANVLEELLKADPTLQRAASEFSNEYVQEVKIEVTRKGDPDKAGTERYVDF